MNEIEKAIKTIKIAIAKVEWNYPLDYAIAFETAIEALQEKAEREKGCEYCISIEQENENGRFFYEELPHDTRLLTTLDDAHLQIAFDNESGWVLHFKDGLVLNFEDGWVLHFVDENMFDVKITHCPHCGRKLGENDG